MTEQEQPKMELTKALVAFQRAMPAIPKNKTAQITSPKGSYSYSYADLASIFKAIREPLAAQGLAVSQLPEISDGDGIHLRTVLLHESGESISGVVCMPATGGAQAFGSALTYARRYGLSAILGLVTEDDDDGGAATPPSKPSKTTRRGPKPAKAGHDKPDSPPVDDGGVLIARGSTFKCKDAIKELGGRGIKGKDGFHWEVPMSQAEALKELSEEFGFDIEGLPAKDEEDPFVKYRQQCASVMDSVSGALREDVEKAVRYLEGSQTAVSGPTLKLATQSIVDKRLGAAMTDDPNIPY